MSTTPTTYAGDLYKILFTHLCEHLEDWDHYLILADWYEENDRPHEAGALRWCAKERRRPWYSVGAGEHHWYTERNEPDRIDPSSALPLPVFENLTGGRVESEDEFDTDNKQNMRRYDTAREAVLDLLRNFNKGANSCRE